MAERRMFSKAIINSARFLRMPPSSRLLYYDLGMAADDDGIVEAFTVLRTTGAAEDDLSVLAAKGFIQILNEDLVSYILDWNKNNYIQKDRYHPSLYRDLMVKIGDGSATDTNCIQDVSIMDTEVRLGKDSIGKYSRGESEGSTPRVPSLAEIKDYCAERNSGVDPQRFYDFYASDDWLDKNGRPINWRQRVISWEREDGRGRPEKDNRNRSFGNDPNIGNAGKDWNLSGGVVYDGS